MMKNRFARLYNFRGKLSRRDFLVYWLWVYLLPKIWVIIAGGGIGFLLWGTDVPNAEIAGSVVVSCFIHVLLISFFMGAVWRRMNDIGFAICPKLLILLLMLLLPPYGWMLQLSMLMLPCRHKES